MAEIKTCLNCGQPIAGRNKLYCNQQCRAEHLRHTHICPICGKEFYAAPSAEVHTCGAAECESEWRSEHAEAAKSNLPAAWDGTRKSPNSGRFETNVTAKSWVIADPSGRTYEINNLKLWCDNNADLLPVVPATFYRGIIDVKKTLLGTKKRGSKQYRGWTIVRWNDVNLAAKDYTAPQKTPRKKMSDDERLTKKRERAREYYRRQKNENIPKTKR